MGKGGRTTVSTLKKWVLLLELPFEIREAQKKGYNHFEADFQEDTKRVQLKMWQRRDRFKRKFPCPCGAEFSNKSALELHRFRLEHGPYAKKEVAVAR